MKTKKELNPWHLCLGCFGLFMIMISPTRPIPLNTLFSGIIFILIAIILHLLSNKKRKRK